MGWSNGTRLMTAVIDTLKEYVVDELDRKRIYKRLIDAFEDADWDEQDQCLGLDVAYDLALKEIHPDWGLDEDEDGLINYGRIAFDAYNEYRGGVNFQGHKTPPWDELPDGVRQAWEIAAEAVKRCLNES